MLSKVTPRDITEGVYSMYQDGWALITAKNGDKWNTMTISWGALGQLWNRFVTVSYVRHSRLTYRFLENTDTFTVAFFEKGKYRAQLGMLGSKSGRDVDKMKESGLTPVELDGTIGFEEACCVLVCKKLYEDTITPDKIPPEIVKEWYTGATEGDLHEVYTAEVTGVYMHK